MRILMLTSVYKDEFLGNKDTSTNIVNSFVKEWKKQGHEVLVIHNSHCYPRVIHEIPEKLKKCPDGCHTSGYRGGCKFLPLHIAYISFQFQLFYL